MMRPFLLILSFLSLSFSSPSIDPRTSIVFGPGIVRPESVYPVRYFFIQAVDKQGNNLTSSLDEKDFVVQIDGIDSPCRIWSQILNRHDGSLIVRYKVYAPCPNLEIKISYKKQLVANSPYVFHDEILQEECYCPKSDVNRWLLRMECPTTYAQIDEDLSIFDRIDMEKVMEKVRNRFNHPKSESVCHYAIVKNEIYRECLGEYVGFKMFVDSILLSLLRKMHIPDLEFIVNLGDWPLERRQSVKDPLPIFSWCKTDSAKDIVMPTYEITESTLESMSRVTLDMLSVQQNRGVLWLNKTNKAIWRGRDSREERLQLVSLSRKIPHLIDAAMTDFFFFRDRMNEFGPTVEHMSFFDFFQYKYQINIDGSVAAYRLPYLLAGGSVVFKQESEYFEHFYKQLRPMIHYIPFARNLSDLVDRIQWALDHDEDAHKIAIEGRKFAQENLMPKDIYCYYVILLKKFSQLLQRPPTLNDNMEHVPQPKSTHGSCDCPRHFLKRDEL